MSMPGETVRITDVLLNDARNTLTPNMHNRALSFLHQKDAGAPDANGPYMVTSGKTSIEVNRQENIPLAAACLAGGRDATVHEAKIRALKQLRAAPDGTYPFGVTSKAGRQMQPPNVLDFVYLNREAERVGTQEFLQELAEKGKNGTKPFIYAFVGPEGSGKDELVRMLCAVSDVAHAVPQSSCDPFQNKLHGITAKYQDPAQLMQKIDDGRLFSLGTTSDGQSAISLEKLRHSNALVTDIRGLERLLMAAALHPNLEVRAIKVNAPQSARRKRMESRGIAKSEVRATMAKDAAAFSDLPCDLAVDYSGDPQKAIQSILKYMQNPVQSIGMAKTSEHIKATQEVESYFKNEIADAERPQGRLTVNTDALQSALSGRLNGALQHISFAELRKQSGIAPADKAAETNSIQSAAPAQHAAEPPVPEVWPPEPPEPVLVPLDQLQEPPEPPENPQDGIPLDLNELYSSWLLEDVGADAGWSEQEYEAAPPPEPDEYVPAEEPVPEEAWEISEPEPYFPEADAYEPLDEPVSADEMLQMLPLPEQTAPSQAEPETGPSAPHDAQMPAPAVVRKDAPAQEQMPRPYADAETYSPHEVYTDGLGEGSAVIPGTRISPDQYHLSGHTVSDMLHTQDGIDRMIQIALHNPTMSMHSQMKILVQATESEVMYPMKTADAWAAEGRMVSPQATAILIPQQCGDAPPHRVYPQSATILVRPELVPEPVHRHPASIVYALTGQADVKLKKAPAVAIAELKKKAAELAQTYLNTEQFTPTELRILSDTVAYMYAVEAGLSPRNKNIEKPFSNLPPQRITPMLGGLSRLTCCMKREMDDLHARGPRIQTKKKGRERGMAGIKKPKTTSRGEKHSFFSR